MKRGRLTRIILLSLCMLLLSLAAVAWFFPQQILTIDNGSKKADAIVILGGAEPDREERAAELFKAGEAPAVLCSGYGTASANRTFLIKAGIPAKHILLEAKSRTTRENAMCSVPMLRALGAKQVIIVTSWYHSRRALMCFEHYAPDIQFYSRPSYFGYEGGTEAGKSNVSNISNSASAYERQKELKRLRGHTEMEYAKLIGYWLCYGICPF